MVSIKQAELRVYLLNETKKRVAEAVTPDILIIQAISSIDETDKVVNTLSKRLREWYALYNPEFERSIENHEAFARLIVKKSKKELLKEVNRKQSMGADLDSEDLSPIFRLANQISFIFEQKEQQQNYVDKIMFEHYPNLSTVAGTMIGAKLIALSGSIKRLTMFPASTVQLLGAEKSFFRHLKNKKSKPPKYGVLLAHFLVNKAKKRDKGRVARAVADKITIACKIDYFKGDFFGDKLVAQLEKRFL